METLPSDFYLQRLVTMVTCFKIVMENYSSVCCSINDRSYDGMFGVMGMRSEGNYEWE